MASIGISESTFALTVLAEQQIRNWGNMVSYPILPSLFAEAGAGWDAYIPVLGTPMFLQFKISDYMSHWKSAHHNFLQTQPYYRFHLHPHLNFQQHARLRALSNSFPDTYYVAPEVNSAAAFQIAYFNQTITEASRFIPLSGCHDIMGGSSHEIIYLPGQDAWQASEPARIDFVRGHDFAKVLERNRKTWKKVDLDFAQELLFRLSDFTHLSPRLPPVRPVEEPLRDLLRLAADSALNLGLHLSIIGEQQS